MSSQAQYKKRLKALMNKPENQVCSDCPERQPRWASLIVPPPGSPPGSLPIGAFCCLECSGSHRRLGVHISFVRSINLDSWKEKEVLAMENGGNKKVNAVFEARLGAARKPTTAADGPTRERFIRDKYERRKYYDPEVLQNYVPDEEPAPSRSTSSTKRGKASRQPSEAARLRAESRRARNGGVETAPKAPPPKSAPPAVPAAAEVDLLDFAAFDSPAPAPAPPAPAAPTSPELDLFASMTVNGDTAATAAPAPSPAQAARKTNDDIMAMFSNPSNIASTTQPTTVGMSTPSGGMMMAGSMPNTASNPMMMQNNGMLMMQGQPAMGPPQPMVMMQGQPNGFGNAMNGQNTMFMQQQGNAMFMQQQGKNTLMVQKNNTGNVMMMQQGQPDNNMMRMMQQASNSDDFGFPQAPMGSGPPIAQSGQFYNSFTQPQQTSQQQQSQNTASPNDPFAQFGTNVFR